MCGRVYLFVYMLSMWYLIQDPRLAVELVIPLLVQVGISCQELNTSLLFFTYLLLLQEDNF